MKKKSKKSGVWIISFIIIAVVASIIILNYEKQCGYDQECINKAARGCYKASALRAEDANILKYQITGKEGEYCKVKITIIEVNPSADYETKQLFQNKYMECKIPKDVPIAESKELIDYCSGPLKESIYELIIKKMYGVIAQNLGSIISEVKENI